MQMAGGGSEVRRRRAHSPRRQRQRKARAVNAAQFPQVAKPEIALTVPIWEPYRACCSSIDQPHWS